MKNEQGQSELLFGKHFFDLFSKIYFEQTSQIHWKITSRGFERKPVV